MAGARPDCDVLILGLGAAGALAAERLTEAGLRVIGVEAGGWTPEQDRGWWRSCVPTVRPNARVRATDSEVPTVMANAVGGSKHLSARQSYRLPAATMAGWPVSAEELSAFHEHVEDRFRVEPSRSWPWLERMSTAAERLGWRPFPAPVATAPPVRWDTLDPALRDGRLQILQRTVACEILTDPDGAITGARVLYDERERVLATRQVVLSAGTYENVRLLLSSRSPAHPHGCGNAGGALGRGFTTHSFLAVHGRFPAVDLGRSDGPAGHATAVAEFEPVERGGSLLQASMGPPPVRLDGGAGAAPWSVGTVWAQPEQHRADGRLDLDPAARDPLGRPRLRATHRLSAIDRRRARALQRRMAEWLRAGGATRTWTAPVIAQTISTHAYGGTCMGADPAASVLDGLGRVHDTPRLTVLGASSFPRPGGRGPTQTIEALAWRAAERLAGELC